MSKSKSESDESTFSKEAMSMDAGTQGHHSASIKGGAALQVTENKIIMRCEKKS